MNVIFQSYNVSTCSKHTSLWKRYQRINTFYGTLQSHEKIKGHVHFKYFSSLSYRYCYPVHKWLLRYLVLSAIIHEHSYIFINQPRTFFLIFFNVSNTWFTYGYIHCLFFFNSLEAYLLSVLRVLIDFLVIY